MPAFRSANDPQRAGRNAQPFRYRSQASLIGGTFDSTLANANDNDAVSNLDTGSLRTRLHVNGDDGQVRLRVRNEMQFGGAIVEFDVELR